VNSSARGGRHDLLTQHSSSGPGAFVDCVAQDALNDSGSHHDWSIGTLYDRAWVNKGSPSGARSGFITAASRHAQDIDDSKDSHGWTGANLVVWNSTAKGYEYYNPPGAQNWLIGSTGDLPAAPNTGPGEQESDAHYDFGEQSEHGTRVSLAPLSTEAEPSLYRVSNAQWRALAASGAIETRHYFVGDPDQSAGAAIGDVGEPFDPINDDVYVNPTFESRLTTWFGSGVGIANFDQAVANHNVPFTVRYSLEQGEQVIGAYLAVRSERVGSWGSNTNHHITLASRQFDTQRRTLHWRCTDVPGTCHEITAAMTGPEGWPASAAFPGVRILDLSDPAMPYLGYLNNTGNPLGAGGWAELSVNFFRKTRIDWAALTLIIRRS